MSHEEFDTLSELEKLELLVNKAAVIGQTSDSHFRMFLYELHSFFIMVSYYVVTDTLLGIYAFKDHQRKVNQAVYSSPVF